MVSQIIINIAKQTLVIFFENQSKTYLISSAKNGVGNQNGSLKTPLGLHKIKLKIGENCPINTIFKARRPTGEIYSPKIKNQNQDWILSRILWLQGLESGVNRGKNIDSLKRYIYIHGTPDSEHIGIAQSHGCIRMRNRDIIELFGLVNNNDTVLIERGK